MSDTTVSQSVLGDLGMDIGFQHKRGVGMPQIMKPNTCQPGAACNLDEGMAAGIGQQGDRYP